MEHAGWVDSNFDFFLHISRCFTAKAVFGEVELVSNIMAI